MALSDVGCHAPGGSLSVAGGVTLNITLFADSAFHQSADFRLLNADTGQVVSDASPKQVVLDYPQWGGVVTYAGVGRLANQDTADWLIDQFERADKAITLSDAAEVIRVEGNRWLSRAGQIVFHTFTLAVYEDSQPENPLSVMAVISNFEDANGVRQSASASLTISWERNPKGQAFLTGSGSQAISDRQRAMLSRVARKQAARPRAIRAVIGRINRRAAEADGGVSHACSCVTLQADGTGEGEHWGELDEPFVPPQVTHGFCHSRASYKEAIELARTGKWPLGAGALHLGIPIQVKGFTLNANRAKGLYGGIQSYRPARPIPPGLLAEIERKRGRNESCWCGSGHKYKKCHGR